MPPLSDSRCVVFDVDGTLYDANTFYDFLPVYFAGRSRAKHSFFRASFSFPGKVFWHLATMATPGEVFRRAALRSLRGESVCDVEAAADAYVRDVLPPARRRDTFERLEQYRERGYRVALMSGSIEPVIDAVARAVGADSAHAVRLEVRGGRYTGRVLSDPKGAKLAAARAAYGADARFDVVTDNRDDAELVRAADRAVVVSRAKHRPWWDGLELDHVEILDAGR